MNMSTRKIQDPILEELYKIGYEYWEQISRLKYAVAPKVKKKEKHTRCIINISEEILKKKGNTQLSDYVLVCSIWHDVPNNILLYLTNDIVSDDVPQMKIFKDVYYFFRGMKNLKELEENTSYIVEIIRECHQNCNSY